jgi:hypothetical protein
MLGVVVDTGVTLKPNCGHLPQPTATPSLCSLPEASASPLLAWPSGHQPSSASYRDGRRLIRVWVGASYNLAQVSPLSSIEPLFLYFCYKLPLCTVDWPCDSAQ